MGDPRPTRSDPRVKEIATRRLAEDCAQWGDETDAAQWEKMLSRCHLNDNGYEIAKDLDQRQHVIAVDAVLVEILDSASSYVWSAHDDLTKLWVEANGIQPSLVIGDRVRTTRGDGTISGIRQAWAKYIVVPDCEAEKFANGGGVILDYEGCTLLERHL